MEYRGLLAAPILLDGELIGALNVVRVEPEPFADEHIQLMKTFADQAAIAIANARLIDSVRRQLEQQRAISDVLGAVARAEGLDSVLHALVEAACRLCAAQFGEVYLVEGDVLRLAVGHGGPPELYEYEREHPEPVAGDRRSVNGRVLLTQDVVHIPDILEDEEYSWSAANEAGVRALLGAPLLVEGQLAGVFNIVRTAPVPFTDDADRAPADVRGPGRDRRRQRATDGGRRAAARTAARYQRRAGCGGALRGTRLRSPRRRRGGLPALPGPIRCRPPRRGRPPPARSRPRRIPGALRVREGASPSARRRPPEPERPRAPLARHGPHPGYPSGRGVLDAGCGSGRCSSELGSSDGDRGGAGGRLQRRTNGARSVHRRADRAAADVRRPGCHRRRQHSPDGGGRAPAHGACRASSRRRWPSSCPRARGSGCSRATAPTSRPCSSTSAASRASPSWPSPRSCSRCCGEYHVGLGELIPRVRRHARALRRGRAHGLLQRPGPGREHELKAVQLALAAQERFEELGAAWRKRGHELGPRDRDRGGLRDARPDRLRRTLRLRRARHRHEPRLAPVERRPRPARR